MTIYRISNLLLVGLLCLGISACKDDDIDPTVDISDEEASIPPTVFPEKIDDELQETCDLPTYVYGFEGSQLSQQIIDRFMVKVASPDQAEVVMIDNASIATLHADDYRTLIEHVYRQGTLVFIHPTADSWQHFWGNYVARQSTDLGATEPLGADDLPEYAAAMYTQLKADTIGVEVVTVGIGQSLGVISTTPCENDYQRGRMADQLVRIIANDQTNRQAENRKALTRSSISEDIEQLYKYQDYHIYTYTFNNSFQQMDKDYNKSARLYWDCPTTVTIKYKSVFDGTSDYYMVIQQVLCENNKFNLNGMKEGNFDTYKNFYKYGDANKGTRKSHVYGPYMVGFETNAEIYDASEYMVVAASPQTTQGTNTIKSTIGYDLSAEVGNYDGWGGSASVSLVSESEDVYETGSDITIAELGSAGKARWMLTIPFVAADDGYFKDTHSIARNVQMNQFKAQFSWIWRVPDANQRSYEMKINAREVLGITFTGGYSKGMYGTKKSTNPFHRENIQLIAPKRYMQEYTMHVQYMGDAEQATAKRKTAEAALAKLLPSYWRNGVVRIFTPDKTSRIEANDYWNALGRLLTKITPSAAKNQGLIQGDKYMIYFRKQGNSKNDYQRTFKVP